MLLLFLTLSFEEFWFLFDLKSFYTQFSYFLRNLKKKFQKKVAKLLKNGFLVLSEQTRTKLKDCRKNQNQTIAKCFSKFETKPNPNPTQTEPNPKNWNQSQLYYRSMKVENGSNKKVVLIFIFLKTKI